MSPLVHGAAFLATIDVMKVVGRVLRPCDYGDAHDAVFRIIRGALEEYHLTVNSLNHRHVPVN